MTPLRRFVLAAALWLPASFFLWAVLAPAVVWPAARISAWLLPALLPEAVAGIEQIGPALEIETRLVTEATPEQRAGILILTANPLIYAWCIAVFAGLVMATPLEARQRLIQFAVGTPVLLAVEAWGAVFDVLKLLAFDAGPLGAAAIEQAGLNVEAVALGYQFGYLILPAVMPILLWVVLNREFLETLVGWRAELDAGSEGRSDSRKESA